MRYNKIMNHTLIRIQWYGNLLAHSQIANGCGRWMILINGNECSNPGSIDYVDYNQKNDWFDYHMAESKRHKKRDNSVKNRFQLVLYSVLGL